MDKLKLLALGKDFEVTEDNGRYKIESKYSNLAAVIEKRRPTKYYLTNCYDSGVDWHDIDVDDFENLKKFCELMKEE